MRTLIFITSVLVFVTASLATAQTAIETVSTLEMGSCIVGKTYDTTIIIKNVSMSVLTIASVRYVQFHKYIPVVVNIRHSATTLQSNEQVSIPISITPRHNVDFRGCIVLQIQQGCRDIDYPILTHGSSSFATSPYADLQNISYDSLLIRLRSRLSGHRSLGYRDARTVMFGKADNVNDSVECIYTGKKLRTVGIPPNGEFNTEHSWVQSRGSSVEPNRSDIHHLYPTFPQANSLRANYPFGNVTTLWKDAGGGSKVGFTATRDTVFEPRDISKGNIARSIFYYLVRYGNLTNYYTSPFLMDSTLRQWNINDRPDLREIARCDTIEAYQKNRNPFVDHPELVERIEFIPTPESVSRTVLPSSFTIDGTSSATLQSIVYNWRQTQLRISSITCSHPDLFTVSGYTPNDTIAMYGYKPLSIRYTTSTLPFPPVASCVISYSNNESDTISFSNCTVTNVVDNTVDNTNPITLYPHPVHSVSKIEFCGSQNTVYNIRVYTIDGRYVADMTHSIVDIGENRSYVPIEYKQLEQYGRMFVVKVHTTDGMKSTIFLLQ